MFVFGRKTRSGNTALQMKKKPGGSWTFSQKHICQRPFAIDKCQRDIYQTPSIFRDLVIHGLFDIYQCTEVHIPYLKMFAKCFVDIYSIPQTVRHVRLDTLEEWFQEANVSTILLTDTKH